MKIPQCCGGTRAGEAQPNKRLIVGDERKFPLKVSRRTGIESVTGITIVRTALFMIHNIKHCFPASFSHVRPAIGDFMIGSRRNRAASLQ
jgi:hypothetical protein